MSALMRPLQVYARTPIHTIGIDAPADDADRLMRHHDVSCLLVMGRDAEPAGVITRSDLLQAARAAVRLLGESPVLQLPTLAVGDLMTAGVVALAATAPMAAGAAELVSRHIHRLFVREGERVVGVVSTKEMIRAVRDARLVMPLSRFMSRPVLSVDVRDPLRLAVEKLGESEKSGLVVLEGEMPVGLFTQREALESRGLSTETPVEHVMSQAMLALPHDTPLFRAAGFTVSTLARRVLAIDHHHVKGIMTGLDFARAIVETTQPSPVAEVAS